MHDELGTYNTQGIATIGMENAVSGLTHRHKRSLPLAHLHSAVLLEPGIVVGEIFCANLLAHAVRGPFLGDTALVPQLHDFDAAVNGGLILVFLFLVGVYMIKGIRTGTSQHRVQRALLTGACAAAGTGILLYTCERRFTPGLVLLLLISIIVPLRSMIRMQQQRRTTLLLGRYRTQAHFRDLYGDC